MQAHVLSNFNLQPSYSSPDDDCDCKYSDHLEAFFDDPPT